MRRRAALVTVSTLLAMSATACDFFSIDGDSTLQVFASHHGMPGDDGAFPDYGLHEAPRAFDTDLGWSVLLEKGVVVIKAVRAVSCDGATTLELETPFGPFPEDFRHEDLEVTNIAEGVIEPAEYCALEVDFGPYKAKEIEEFGDAHAVNNPDTLEGYSILMRGRASKDGQDIDFDFKSPAAVTATIDISTIVEGGPLEITKSDARTINLTVVKSYDALLQGVDFAAVAPEAAAMAMTDALIDTSYVIYGTSQ